MKFTKYFIHIVISEPLNVKKKKNNNYTDSIWRPEGIANNILLGD